MPAADRRRFAEHIIADSDRLAALLERLRMLARTDVPLDAKGVTLRRPPTCCSSNFRHSKFPLPARRKFRSRCLGSGGDRPFAPRRHSVAHGARTLTIDCRSRDARLHVFLADDGSGISPGNRDRIFEPFFTTRREQGGTGMGLGIVRTMLQAHGGAISLAESASGAAFEIVIPILPP